MKKLPREELCNAAGRAITMDDLRETMRLIRRERYVTPYQARCNEATMAVLQRQFVPGKLREIHHVIMMVGLPVVRDDALADGVVEFDYPTMPDELKDEACERPTVNSNPP